MLGAQAGAEPMLPWERAQMLHQMNREAPELINQLQEKNTDRLLGILNTAVGMGEHEIKNPINQWLMEDQMHYFNVPFGYEDEDNLDPIDPVMETLGLAWPVPGERMGMFPGFANLYSIPHEAGHLAIPEHGLKSGMYQSEANQRWLDSLTNPKGSFERRRADARVGIHSNNQEIRSEERARMAVRLMKAGVPRDVVINGLYQQGQIEEKDD